MPLCVDFAYQSCRTACGTNHVTDSVMEIEIAMRLNQTPIDVPPSDIQWKSNRTIFKLSDEKIAWHI